MNAAHRLVELQEIDQRMAVRKSAYRKVAAQLAAEGDLNTLREQCEASRLDVLERRLAHGRLESEVATLRERLQDIESKLYGGAVTSVRELTALEEEHSNIRRSLAQAEESLLPAGLAAEEAQTRYLRLKEELAMREQEWKKTRSELEKEARRVHGECAELESERARAAAGIPPGDLALYRSLLPRKHGVAVTGVERGICQGCRIKLPLRELRQLKSSDRLVVCSSCGRILIPS